MLELDQELPGDVAVGELEVTEDDDLVFDCDVSLGGGVFLAERRSCPLWTSTSG